MLRGIRQVGKLNNRGKQDDTREALGDDVIVAIQPAKFIYIHTGITEHMPARTDFLQFFLCLKIFVTECPKRQVPSQNMTIMIIALSPGIECLLSPLPSKPISSIT